MADGLYRGGVLGVAPTQTVKIDASGVTITSADGLPVTINAPGGATVNGDMHVTGGHHDRCRLDVQRHELR